MTKLRPKHPRLKLDPKGYRKLRQQVLERDGWRCQRCGHIGELHVHHAERRSQLGSDIESNLLALCADCHQAIHGKSQR